MNKEVSLAPLSEYQPNCDLSEKAMKERLAKEETVFNLETMLLKAQRQDVRPSKRPKTIKASLLSQDQKDDVTDSIVEYLKEKKTCTFQFEEVANLDIVKDFTIDDLYEPLLEIATLINNEWKLRRNIKQLYRL